MLKTIVVDGPTSDRHMISEALETHCPQVDVLAEIEHEAAVEELIKASCPDALFIDIDANETRSVELLKRVDLWQCRKIVVSRKKQFAFEALRNNSSAYLLKPILRDELVRAISKVEDQVEQRRRLDYQLSLLQSLREYRKHRQLISIPNMKGCDYVQTNDIVCFSGLRKCTQVITTSSQTMLSSYPLAHFKKMLHPMTFFSPHRSYLINLQHVVQYRREGTIKLVGDLTVPITNRNKEEFLNRIEFF